MALRTIQRGAVPVALIALFTFGCTTVRAPASAITADPVVGENGAEPQVELWLESAGPVTEAERREAVAQVRAALDRATATLVSQDEEALLVVRAQGIARTGSRKANQSAAKVGIAVGAVALVAIVVVAVVASGKGGGGSVPKLGGGVARAGGGVARAVPRAAGGFRAAPPRFAFPVPVGGSHRHHGSGPAMAIGVQVPGPVGPAPTQAGLVAAGPVQPPPPEAQAPLPEYEGMGPEERTAFPPAEPIRLDLPHPPRLDVSHRKFFDKDFTRLQLLVVDRATGRATWAKIVEGNVDPRDARAVKRLVAKGIEVGGWEPLGTY